MNKKEAIKWVVDTKAISAFTRNFVEYLYKEGYVIVKPLGHLTKYSPEEEWIRIK